MPSRAHLDWFLFAAITAVASHFVAPATTPIDRALPFVVVLLSACALAVEDSGPPLSGKPRAAVLHLLIVLLLLPPIIFSDEHTRLLAYGVIAAVAFAAAAVMSRPERHIVLVVCGVLLLRWIPFSKVVVWRELIVFAGVLVVFLASRSLILALAIAAVTPAFPARLMVLPFVVGILTAILPRLRIPISVRVPIYGCAIALFAMWPWSGIVARALPAFLRSESAPGTSRPLWIALAPGESVSIDAPALARSVEITASGANASRLRNGTLMGIVEADGIRREIRIGDVADFGYTRRELFFRSRNRAPMRPLNDVKDYGQTAWLHTAGLIAISPPRAFQSIRVSASRDLPPAARLQIEAVDFE